LSNDRQIPDETQLWLHARVIDLLNSGCAKEFLAVIDR
jgi:hypothetical protein